MLSSSVADDLVQLVDSLRGCIELVLDTHYTHVAGTPRPIPRTLEADFEHAADLIAALSTQDQMGEHKNLLTIVPIQLQVLMSLRDVHQQILHIGICMTTNEFVIAAQTISVVITRIHTLETASEQVQNVLNNLINPKIIHSIKRDVFLKRANLLRQLSQMFSCSFVDPSASSLPSVSSMMSTDAISSSLIKSFSDGSEFKVNYVISAIPSETFYDSPPTLAQVLQALYHLDELSPMISKLSDHILNSFCKPVLDEATGLLKNMKHSLANISIPSKCKVITISNAKLSATLKLSSMNVFSLPSNYENEGIPLSKKVDNSIQTSSNWNLGIVMRFSFIQISKVVEFWTKSIFDYISEELDQGEFLSENVSYMFWDIFRLNLINKIKQDFLIEIVSLIANSNTPSSEIDKELDQCVYEIRYLDNKLKEINLEVFGVGNDDLQLFIEDIGTQVEKIKERHIYSIARDILMTDDSNIILVDKELGDVYGINLWKSKDINSVDIKEKSMNGKGMSFFEQEFILPEFMITSKCRSLIDLVYNIMEITLEDIKDSNNENKLKNMRFVLFTSRNLILMYKAITPYDNSQSSLESITKTCLYYNNSIYIANHLIMLGFKFKDRFSDSLSDISTLLDLTPDILSEGQKCLENMIIQQLNSIDDNFKLSTETLSNLSKIITLTLNKMKGNIENCKFDKLIIKAPNEIADGIEKSIKYSVLKVKKCIKQAELVLDKKTLGMFSALLCKQILINFENVLKLCIPLIALNEANPDKIISLDSFNSNSMEQISLLTDMTSNFKESSSNIINIDSRVDISIDNLRKSILSLNLSSDKDILHSWFEGKENIKSSTSSYESLKIMVRYILRMVLSNLNNIEKTVHNKSSTNNNIDSSDSKLDMNHFGYKDMLTNMKDLNDKLEKIPYNY